MPTSVDRILQNALAQLKAERDKLDRRIGAIENALSDNKASRPVSAQPKRPQGRRQVSEATRKAIARKLKAYWAKRKAGTRKGRGKVERAE
jgi:capsid protein